MDSWELFSWQCPKCYIAVCSITVEAFPYLTLIMSMSGRNFLWPDEQCLWVCSPICHWSCDVFVVQVQKLFLTKWANRRGFFPLSPISIWWGTRLTQHPGSHCTNYSFKFPWTAWNWTGNHWHWLSNVLVTYCCWKRSGSLKTCQKWDEVSTSTSARISEGSRVFDEYLHNTSKHRSSCRFWSMVAQ